ncbi:hypothetical protein [Streptomyces sp. NPDC047009]|uniref:hypothetical protein n=1 Tax=Streptomyces sp. NPDC047009 TaxID=3154496 RepID=UPI0033FC268B
MARWDGCEIRRQTVRHSRAGHRDEAAERDQIDDLVAACLRAVTLVAGRVLEIGQGDRGPPAQEVVPHLDAFQPRQIIAGGNWSRPG